ncbi:MAG: RNA polymerase sigma factor [Candidatus Paceibacteria bacterium]
MEKTDAELIADYLAGDESAFASLLNRHLQSVYSFAFRSARDDAADIAQETFLKAWKHLSAYDPEQAQFKTWLMRIARNTVIDHLRRKKAIVFSSLEDEQGDNLALLIPDAELLPDEVVARVHDSRELNEALEQLSPLQKEVILLHYMDHMTFEEISEVLAESPNTVRSRARRGLLQLKLALEQMHQKAT